MLPFRPLVRNPHAQTILANFWPRRLDGRRYPVVEVLHQTGPGVRVLIHRQQPAKPSGQVVLVHGLEGSSQGGYMRSLAQALLDRGYTVHRMNIRGCGGTESLSDTLYHSGLTADLHHLIAELGRGLRPLFLAGFSLGGNQVLKFAGELGERGPASLDAVCAVSVPLDLLACVRELARPHNRVYERRFVRRLVRRMRLRQRLMPGRFPFDLAGIRTVYEFDDRVTAPYFGFGTAENYYNTQSAKNFLDRIALPACVIHAADDPMIPLSVFDHPAFGGNPRLELVTVPHGGHTGFLQRGRPTRFWLDEIVPNWFDAIREQFTPRTRPR